jgi:hypothetical protein
MWHFGNTKHSFGGHSRSRNGDEDFFLKMKTSFRQLILLVTVWFRFQQNRWTAAATAESGERERSLSLSKKSSPVSLSPFSRPRNLDVEKNIAVTLLWVGGWRSVCVCVCVCVRERERERKEGERESTSTCQPVCGFPDWVDLSIGLRPQAEKATWIWSFLRRSLARLFPILPLGKYECKFLKQTT